MDRSLRKFLQLYRILRNSNVSLNYIAPLQSVQNVSRTYSSTLIDHIQLEDVTLPMGKYHVSSDNKRYKSIKILEEAAGNYMNMTLDEAVDTMSAVFKSCRHARDVPNIGKHKGFVCLCEVLNRNSRLMKTNDVIECLKIFTYFKIPSNSIIVQSLLQMIRTTINELSLRDIIFIVYLLKKIDSTPLSDALLIALPLVFEAQLPIKLDIDDLDQLTWSLRFINESSINNQEIQNIILKALLNHRNSMSTQAAWSVFYSLCSTPRLSPLAFEVLSDVQKILVTNAKELSIQQIIKTFDKFAFVTGKNKEQGLKLYNEAIVDAFINSALFSNINFADGLHLLKLLNYLNYAYIPFLEYLAAKCFEQPSLLKNISYFKLCIFLEGLVNADYKPVFWDAIRDVILANDIEDKSFSKSMIRFALHMIALDCYNPRLLDRVFSRHIKDHEPLKDTCARELLLLYQSVKTLYPTYDGSWPQENILDHAIALGPIPPTFSLRSALELALGGSQYVHNNLKTRLGHYIDHVVVMRKGRYPVASNITVLGRLNTIYVEDIQAPNESQIILIFNLPDCAYAINSQRLKSTWSLRIKSAEAFTKSSAIAINSSSWMKLPEYERVPYLMQAIKLKCEDYSID